MDSNTYIMLMIISFKIVFMLINGVNMLSVELTMTIHDDVTLRQNTTGSKGLNNLFNTWIILKEWPSIPISRASCTLLSLAFTTSLQHSFAFTLFTSTCFCDAFHSPGY